MVKKGIQHITLIGDSDLIRCIILELHYSDKVFVSGAFSSQSESNPLGSFAIYLSIQVFNDNTKIEDDNVLVCNTIKDPGYNESIQKLKKVNIFELSSIIEDVYREYLIYKPLQMIMRKNPEVPVVVLFLPYLTNVKNRSENENKILESKLTLDKVRSLLLEKKLVNEIPEAIKIHKSDIEYARNIMAYSFKTKIDGVYKMNDQLTPYVNVVNGVRKTFYQPDKYDGSIYFFGHSVIFGRGAEDKDTIESYFQRELNRYAEERGIPSRLVVNYANISSWDCSRMFPLMKSIKFQHNDIIVIPGLAVNIARQYGCITCEAQKEFDRPHDMGEVFVDIAHLNGEGNKKIAECLFETFIQNDLLSGNYQNKIIPESNEEHHSEQEDEYKTRLNSYKTMLSQTREHALGKIGSIVMNCNPFTLGHRYLIEYAAKNVKHLFIFVVEEGKSIFPFKDRLELVKAGTADLGNVTVLPSGQFIISSLTFKDYFDKAEIQDRVIDPSRDVELFAKEIAPTLGITIRFVGEEPLDNITRQYNDAMRRILPQYGITFEVIPRKESDGEVISASRVRKFLETKDFESIAKLVPETTLNYLKERSFTKR